jgi:uncharacterized protein (DUF983 family)
MYTCPTCNARTISFFRKWLSYPTLPAHCRACGNYSHAQRSSGGLGLVVALVAITLSGFAAMAFQAAWPLLLGICGSIGFYWWHWHHISLQALSPEAVSVARKTEGLGMFALLVAVIFN